MTDGPGRDEAHLFFQQELLEGRSFAVAGGVAALYSKRSPEKETPNEDAVAIIATGPESGIFAVADGLGGAPAGQQASSLAIRCLARSVAEARGGARVRLHYPRAQPIVEPPLARIQLDGDGRVRHDTSRPHPRR